MSKQQLLALSGANPIGTIGPDAYKLKADALAVLGKFTTVENQDQMDDAIIAIGVAKGLVKEINTVREDLARPVNQALKTFKATADTFCTELVAEVGRLETLCGALVQKQRDAARKLEEERLKAQREIEESNRRLAEAARQLEAAKNKKARAEAQKELQRANEQAFDAAIKIEEIAMSDPVEVPQTEGASVSQEDRTDFEVEDPDALYQAYPHCCELVIKKNLVKAMIDAGTREIPGVRIFEKAATMAVRAISTKATQALK